jgi:hypothetical protein
VKPENGESCGTLTPTTHPEGTISADLSDDHAVSATVTGLDDGATYCALFSASNWLGQGFTNYLETTTTDATAPSRPAGLAANSVTKTSSTISWPGATDNVGVTGYRVYREGDLLTTTTDPSTNVSSVCGETAHFIVTAVDGAGNESEPSDAFTLHAAACDPPPLPGGGAAKSCFVKQAPKTLKLKKNRKTVKATVTSTVAADGQSVTVTAKAKGAKITFKVDSKGVTPNKGSIVVTGKTSVAAVTFKLIGKARTVSLHFTSSAC